MTHRGDGFITDISKEGLCCQNLNFFRDNPESLLSLNTKVLISFSLPQEDKSRLNFEIFGFVRSIKKSSSGQITTIGIRIFSMKRGNKKNLISCIQTLEKQEN